MSLFLQKLFNPKTPSPQQLPALIPIQGGFKPPAKRPIDNPFLAALDRDAQGFNATYGVNRPLKKAMFLGYKGEKALYGGSRLFVLY